jgi:hypothetical protein
MRLVLALLATFALVGAATAADIARGPDYIEGLQLEYNNQLVGGDVLIVEIIEGVFTDLAPTYSGAFSACGHSADILYDPAGNWGNTAGYELVLINTSDDWFSSYNYGAEMATAAAWVEDGKCLWIIGQDFLFGCGPLCVGFVQSYCGVASVFEDANFGDANMVWSGTAGGLLAGMNGAFIPCYAANPFFTDDVTPLVQGLVMWQTETYGPAEGGAQGPGLPTLFSAVDWGCDPTVNQVVCALLAGCFEPPIPTIESTWGQIKNHYR